MKNFFILNLICSFIWAETSLEISPNYPTINDMIIMTLKKEFSSAGDFNYETATVEVIESNIFIFYHYGFWGCDPAPDGSGCDGNISYLIFETGPLAAGVYHVYDKTTQKTCLYPPSTSSCTMQGYECGMEQDCIHEEQYCFDEKQYCFHEILGTFVVSSPVEIKKGVPFLDRDIKIIQNPFSKKIILSFPNLKTKIYNMNLYNPVGELVKKIGTPGSNSLTIPSNFFTPGIYLLKGHVGINRFSKKIIITK